MWRCFVGWGVRNISEEHAASIFRVTELVEVDAEVV
jgi:hypothetical protein